MSTSQNPANTATTTTTTTTATPTTPQSAPSPTHSIPKSIFFLLSDIFYMTFILLRLLLIPITFVLKAVQVYFFACIWSYVIRTVNSIFTFINGRLCKCIDLRYIDYKFPPVSTSVNQTDPKGEPHLFQYRFDCPQLTLTHRRKTLCVVSCSRARDLEGRRLQNYALPRRGDSLRCCSGRFR